MLKVEDLVNKICAGNFVSSDIGLLFIWLRPKFTGKPMLLDLANFVAHHDDRDRGISFEHIQSFVQNFIEVSERAALYLASGQFFTNSK